MLEYKLPEDVVHGIIRGAVNIERRFICEALSCDLIGMNSEPMTRYIELVADRCVLWLPDRYGENSLGIQVFGSGPEPYALQARL